MEPPSDSPLSPLDRASALLSDRLAKLRGGQPPAIDQELMSKVRTALDLDDVGRSYALLVQPLCKVLQPSADIRSLAPSDWTESSPRSVSRAAIEVNSSLGCPLVQSDGPYVSNPLRPGPPLGSEEWTQQRRPVDRPKWKPTLDLLDGVEAAADPAAAASDLLDAVLARLVELSLNPTKVIAQMSVLQQQILAGEDVHSSRRELLEGRAVRMFESAVEQADLSLSVEASTGLGTPAEVPWLRFYNPEHSPSATKGQYIVLLFAADGGIAYLALIIGTEELRQDQVTARVDGLRALLGPQSNLQTTINLHSKQSGGRPRAYERGTVYAVEYPSDQPPTDAQFMTDLARLASLLAETESAGTEDPGGLLHRLTPEAARDALGDLVIPDTLLLDALAALRAGKHLLLTGPPGTGKTTLAQRLAKAAHTAGICSGSTTVTATATWTSYDIVGGYHQQLDGLLRFERGSALRSIDDNSWLVIDELNRADIDKALGPLFTVLSGQAVELTLQEAQPDGTSLPVAIVPPGQTAPARTSTHEIRPGWRIIATMNTWDQDLLFSMSYALLRRFAVINVDPPELARTAELLGEAEPLDDPVLAASVSTIADLPHARLGPAVLRAVARFVRERRNIGAADESADDWVLAALSSEVVPQLSHLSADQLTEVAGFLAAKVLVDSSPAQVAGQLSSQMGITISPPPPDEVFEADEVE